MVRYPDVIMTKGYILIILEEKFEVEIKSYYIKILDIQMIKIDSYKCLRTFEGSVNFLSLNVRKAK